LIRNEYGHKTFANLFFFITGFHGFHVSVGVLLNIIIFFNVLLGTYEKRRSYEMVEKVGLYWHFVDLVWVFVFTFFYLLLLVKKNKYGITRIKYKKNLDSIRNSICNYYSRSTFGD